MLRMSVCFFKAAAFNVMDPVNAPILRAPSRISAGLLRVARPAGTGRRHVVSARGLPGGRGAGGPGPWYQPRARRSS